MEMSRNSSFACGASVAGPSHVAKNIPNQDAFFFAQKRNYTLLVVSDGMGSKPFADVGSGMVCRAVNDEIERFASKKQGTLSVEQLLKNIVSAWEILVQPHSPTDCSATCLFLFATRSKILACKLGDGMICLLGNSEGGDVLLTDEKDDAFSNETLSLSDSHAAAEFAVGVYDRPNFCGAILSTDGISSDIENGKELAFAHDVFVELSAMHFCERQNFLRNMMEAWPVPHHTDDKTIVAAGL